MQGLSDKIAVLRKKYENDKQKLGVETMNLYKAHGVIPFGGCLPSLIQMPIWIALFSTLNYAVEIYHSSFFWYITDLSAKDPYYLAPLLMGAVMFVQMRMSPAGTDPQQQKMMAIMMPVMFTGFSLFLPAGLSIYTLTSYLIGILQQLYVNRLYRLPPPAVPAKSLGPRRSRIRLGPDRPLTMRIRQHVNPLRADFLEIPLEPLALPRGSTRRGRAGLGGGAVPRWSARPRIPIASYVGVEIRRELVDAVEPRCAAPGAGAGAQRVRQHLASTCPGSSHRRSVTRFFVNFPDPWFKQRQRKRRVVSEELVEQLAILLVAGGEIHVATDIFDIALDAMAALEGNRPLRELCASPGPSCARAASSPARGASATAKRWASGCGAWPIAAREPRHAQPSSLRSPLSVLPEVDLQLLELMNAIAKRGGLLEFQLLGQVEHLPLERGDEPGQLVGRHGPLALLGQDGLGRIPAVVLRGAGELVDGLLDGLGRDAVLAVELLLQLGAGAGSRRSPSSSNRSRGPRT